MFVKDANSIIVVPPFRFCFIAALLPLFVVPTYIVVIYIPTKLNYILPTVVFYRI